MRLLTVNFGLMIEILDVIGRTAVVYIAIVGAIVLFGKKELAQLSIVDLVLVLLISNSVQNAMVGPSTSLQAGLVSAGTIFVLNALLKWLIFNNQWINKVVEGEPIVLIKDGVIIDTALQRQKITLNELNAAVREHGIDCIENVQIALLEIDGNISVVSYNDSDAKETYFDLQHHRRNKKFKKHI